MILIRLENASRHGVIFHHATQTPPELKFAYLGPLKTLGSVLVSPRCFVSGHMGTVCRMCAASMHALHRELSQTLVTLSSEDHSMELTFKAPPIEVDSQSP